MKSSFVAYKNSAIHYCIWGSGLKLLFCFHGYGEQAESFAALEETLGAHYTLIAINMPFHGKTEWAEGLLFTVADLQKIIDQILQAHQSTNQPINQSTSQPVNQSTNYSLLGYSMGGRVALHLLQTNPEVIERVVLVAPDGLHKNPWYWFVTQTSIGNRLFKHFMYKPSGMAGLFGLAEKYRLLHASQLKIARHYMGQAQDRVGLYRRWTAMRKFKPNPLLLKNIIKQHAIPVRFLFGRFDNIILSSRSDIFKDDTQNIQIHVIDAGHRLLQEKYLPIIWRLFYE